MIGNFIVIEIGLLLLLLLFCFFVSMTNAVSDIFNSLAMVCIIIGVIDLVLFVVVVAVVLIHDSILIQ
jgi:hypothetical protein